MMTEAALSKCCPLCGKANTCQADTAPHNCWCLEVTVPQELIDKVPSNLRDKACICRVCIERYHQDQKNNTPPLE